MRAGFATGVLPGAVAAWCAILALAFANGALREIWLLPALGLPWAQLLSGALLTAGVLALTAFALPRLPVRSTRQALALGTFWMALTLLFEFGFGRLVQGKPWRVLFAAYAFADGNLWPVVLLAVLAGPAALRPLCPARGRDVLQEHRR